MIKNSSLLSRVEYNRNAWCNSKQEAVSSWHQRRCFKPYWFFGDTQSFYTLLRIQDDSIKKENISQHIFVVITVVWKLFYVKKTEQKREQLISVYFRVGC